MFLRSSNQVLDALRWFVRRVWMSSGVLSLVFVLLSIYAIGTGGPAFQWLRRTTNQDSWALAVSAGFFTIFEVSVGVALTLMVLQFVLRTVLLFNADPGTGVVLSLRQTGASLNRQPVMAMKIRVDTPAQPIVTVRKLMDLGNIPRPGDRVRLRISRADPTCVGYQGVA